VALHGWRAAARRRNAETPPWKRAGHDETAGQDPVLGDPGVRVHRGKLFSDAIEPVPHFRHRRLEVERAAGAPGLVEGSAPRRLS
jgi:hypothetical protein